MKVVIDISEHILSIVKVYYCRSLGGKDGRIPKCSRVRKEAFIEVVVAFWWVS